MDALDCMTRLSWAEEYACNIVNDLSKNGICVTSISCYLAGENDCMDIMFIGSKDRVDYAVLSHPEGYMMKFSKNQCGDHARLSIWREKT